MHAFAVPFHFPFLMGAMVWIAWLLWDGWRSGAVWVKGGEADRFTRPLSMASFAHKVARDDRPFVYWLNMGLFAVTELLGCVLLWRH